MTTIDTRVAATSDQLAASTRDGTPKFIAAARDILTTASSRNEALAKLTLRCMALPPSAVAGVAADALLRLAETDAARSGNAAPRYRLHNPWHWPRIISGLITMGAAVLAIFAIRDDPTRINGSAAAVMAALGLFLAMSGMRTWYEGRPPRSISAYRPVSK